MSFATDFLVNIRKIVKLHESMLKEICEKYRLTYMEASIISFLHNNPGRDTAADIVELRNFQKSNVSQAVETLYQKTLLSRSQDREDRRKIHLCLTARAKPILEDIEEIWSGLEKGIFAGLTGEEKELFMQLNARIQENIQQTIERRN